MLLAGQTPRQPYMPRARRSGERAPPLTRRSEEEPDDPSHRAVAAVQSSSTALLLSCVSVSIARRAFQTYSK